MHEVSHIPSDTRSWERWPQSEVQMTDTPRPPQGVGLQGRFLGASVKGQHRPFSGEAGCGLERGLLPRLQVPEVMPVACCPHSEPVRCQWALFPWELSTLDAVPC